jgi:ACS family hexuronate transporter-like MFS transporter
MVLGAAGLVWVLAWVLWFRPPPGLLESSVGKGRTLAPEDRWGAMLSSPRLWACIVGAAFTIPIIHITSAWIPTYLNQQWGLPLGPGMAVFLFLIYLGMDLGFIGGGAVISYLVRRGMGAVRARKVVMAASAGLMLSAAAVPLAPTAPLAVALLFFVLMGRASWGAIFLAFNQDVTPGRVSMVAGIMGCIGSFSGALLIGAIGLISKQSGFTIPFLMIALLVLLGMFPVLLVRWEPAERNPEPGREGTKLAVAEKG